MATKSSSAEKRQKQDEKRRIQNKMVKSSVKTAARRVVTAAHAKDKVQADAAIKAMIKEIDTAARKGIIKKNTAARKKSRMQRLVNVLGA